MPGPRLARLTIYPSPEMSVSGLTPRLGERNFLGEATRLTRGEHCGIWGAGEGGVPTPEVVGELVVEDPGTDLKERVGATGCPAHLLFFDHALADHLVDCRLGERGGDGFAGAAAFTCSLPRQQAGI
jgi:hypothetical protein